MSGTAVYFGNNSGGVCVGVYLSVTLYVNKQSVVYTWHCKQHKIEIDFFL